MASEADLPPADDFLDAARMRAAIGRCLRRQPGGEAASAVRPPVGDFDLNPADLEVRAAVPVRAAAVAARRGRRHHRYSDSCGRPDAATR